MDWDQIISLVVIADIFLNFFFNILQFGKFCIQLDVVNSLEGKATHIIQTLRNVDNRTRELHSISLRESQFHSYQDRE